MDDELGRQIAQALDADTIKKYLSRGRRFRELSDDEVAQGWVNAYRARYEERNKTTDAAEEDYSGELLIRGLAFPHSSELEKVRTQLRARGGTKLENLTPEGLAALEEFIDLIEERKRVN